MRVNQINKNKSKPCMLYVEMLSVAVEASASTRGMSKAQEV